MIKKYVIWKEYDNEYVYKNYWLFGDDHFYSAKYSESFNWYKRRGLRYCNDYVINNVYTPLRTRSAVFEE